MSWPSLGSDFSELLLPSLRALRSRILAFLVLMSRPACSILLEVARRRTCQALYRLSSVLLPKGRSDESCKLHDISLSPSCLLSYGRASTHAKNIASTPDPGRFLFTTSVSGAVLGFDHSGRLIVQRGPSRGNLGQALSALLQQRSRGRTAISRGELVSTNHPGAVFLSASSLISFSETLASGLRAPFRVEESHAGLPSHDVKRHMAVVRRLTTGSLSHQRSMVRFT